MKKLILFYLIFFTTSGLEAQIQLDLDVDLIPMELRSNANAVIRNEEITMQVIDLDNVIYKKKISITILNSSGEDYAVMVVHYDKSRIVKNLKGNLYDQEGKLVYKIPESKFKDYSNISGFSLFEDNRVKYFNPAYSNYPFTVEFEYEVKEKNTFYFPDWVPQSSGDLAVEKSSYRFICKENYQVRIKELNFTGDKAEKKEKGAVVYTWNVQSLKPYKYETYSPRRENFLPTVKISPVKFEYEGIAGSFTNWKEFGDWYFFNLLKGRDTLSSKTYHKIKELTKDISSPKEKAKVVYEYVQNKTRYVSIQVGIGGFQPMTAEQVDQVGYGDCKALSNYTKALLKAVGIPSIYTVVYADNFIRDISSEFANVQGNHVILCVPFEKDTVWLECTSQTAPFGYLGTFTDNRKVILITEKGGVIAKTKSYSTQENTQIRKATFKMDAEGNIEGKLETNFKGTQYENRDHILGFSGKERTERILKLYPVNNIEIRRFDIKQHKIDNPVITEEFDFFAKNYGAKSNNRIFLMVNPVNQFSNFLKDQGGRKNPIWISRGYLDEDVLEYLLPEDYQIELLPKNIEIKNEFGEFSCKVRVSGNKLIYQRKMLLNEGTYPSDRYEELRKYYLKISAADQQKVVLVKN